MASGGLEEAEAVELALLDMPDLVLEAIASLLPIKDRLRLLSCCRRLHQLGRTSPKIWASALWVLISTLVEATSFVSWLQPRKHLLNFLDLHTEPSAYRRARERAAALKLRDGTAARKAARGGGHSSSSSSSASSASSGWPSEDSDELSSGDEDEEYDSEPAEDGVEYWLLGALAGSHVTALRCGFKCACITLGGLLATLPRLRELHVAAFDITVIPAFAAALPQLRRLSVVAGTGQDGEVSLSPGCLPAGLTSLAIAGMGVGVLRDIIAPAGLSELLELRLSEPSRWSDGGGSSSEEESEEEEDEASDGGYGASRCRLVTEGLETLTALLSLSLRSTRLKAVPPQVTALTRLRSLDLGSNFKFTGLGLGLGGPHQVGLDLLEGLPLFRLDLQNNNLQALPPWMWRELKVLSLFSNSGLQPPQVMPLPSTCPLEVLSLDLSVAIRCATFLGQLPQLRSLHLGGLSLADGAGVAALLEGLRLAPKLQLMAGSSQLEQIAASNSVARGLLKELRERGVRFDPESREHSHLH